MNDFDVYATMACHPGMTDLEIKVVQRQLSRRYHPDREGGDAPTFAAIQAAFAKIKDTKARASLLGRLKGLGDPCPKCRGQGYTVKKKGFTVISPPVPCTECQSCGYLRRYPV